jgi:hypothetical protein
MSPNRQRWIAEAAAEMTDGPPAKRKNIAFEIHTFAAMLPAWT